MSKASTVYHGKSNKTRCHLYRRFMSNTKYTGPIWNGRLYIHVHCECSLSCREAWLERSKLAWLVPSCRKEARDQGSKKKALPAGLLTPAPTMS